MHSIATIINYCTNDHKFLRPCIDEVKHFSSQILIPVSDHFFDGTPENRGLLNHAYREHSDCEFIEFAYDPNRPYGFSTSKRPDDLDWARHWHSTARMIGYFHLRKEIEYVLFIDVDEIYEGRPFKAWLDQFDYRDYSALRFTSYEYFREPCYRAKEIFTSGLMARKSLLTPKQILNVDERMGLYRDLPEKKIMHLMGLEEQPLIHHYSWVRTQEEMLKKTATWSHHWERDWASLIEKEFSAPVPGKNSLTNQEYERVEPYIALMSPKPAHRVTYSEIFRKELAEEFNLQTEL